MTEEWHCEFFSLQTNIAFSYFISVDLERGSSNTERVFEKAHPRSRRNATTTLQD
jgi:hypothetical protein